MAESISESPLADRIGVKTHIVLHRSGATPRTLADIRAAKVYEPGAEGSVCELVAGGARIATGKLVKRRGRWCLLIETIGEEL